jgi:hypothetical protein
MKGAGIQLLSDYFIETEQVSVRVLSLQDVNFFPLNNVFILQNWSWWIKIIYEPSKLEFHPGLATWNSMP